MAKKITIKEIAQALKVSISTVSKALKDSYEISTETKNKIRAYAKSKNYIPNQAAINLKKQSTKTIAVIIPEIVHEFFSKVIFGIEEFALTKGYHVLICVSNESLEKEALNMKMLANNSVDGFIVSLSKGTQFSGNLKHITDIIEDGIPVVMFDRVNHEVDCNKVIIDDFQSGYLATKHLLDLGCTKIGLLTTPDFVSVGRERKLGFLKAIKEAGIKENKQHILQINAIQNSDQVILDFLKNNFDGIIGVNEVYAIRAMNLHKMLGKNIPEDCKYIGFSNGILSRNSTPQLSVIEQKAVQMGADAADLLIKDIESKIPQDKYETKILNAELIIRASTFVE